MELERPPKPERFPSRGVVEADVGAGVLLKRRVLRRRLRVAASAACARERGGRGDSGDAGGKAKPAKVGVYIRSM